MSRTAPQIEMIIMPIIWAHAQARTPVRLCQTKNQLRHTVTTKLHQFSFAESVKISIGPISTVLEANTKTNNMAKQRQSNIKNTETQTHTHTHMTLDIHTVQ